MLHPAEGSPSESAWQPAGGSSEPFVAAASEPSVAAACDPSDDAAAAAACDPSVPVAASVPSGHGKQERQLLSILAG